MTLEEFLPIRKSLPEEPGIYKYFDHADNWLYVGKAKNLKKRVSQYFLDNKQANSKTKTMVKLITRIEFTIVNSESDALILENSLIKENQPRYNIRLKDDKTYPFVIVKNEGFPRVFFTRKYIKDGSEYFGPYTSVLLAKDIFHTIKTIFPLRSCTLSLTKKNIEQKKFKTCLEYHIGNCLAPCVGYQSEEEYDGMIDKIRAILKGKFTEVRIQMQDQMLAYAEKLDFENAEKWKLRINQLGDFETKSVIFNPSWDQILTVNLYKTQNKTLINYLKIENGTIVASKSFEVEYKNDESNAEILEHFINGFVIEDPEIKEVVIPEEIGILKGKIKQVIPLLGDKKRLLEISYHNARSYAMTLFTDPKFERKRKEFNVLKELQDKLHLTTLPIHIECFDNSNIQGTSPVSACVVFKNGKPVKKDYRHFHVKTVIGPDDFASMREIIYRRYKRMIDDHEELPSLIVVDGGKGQLSHAIEALDELGISDKVPIVGIAKRLEEIYFKNDPIPLYIDKKSPALKLIQQMRDEAHRFGLAFHRDTRSKGMIKSSLDSIEGLGKSSIEKLLKEFKSLSNIQAAPREEIEKIIGKNRTNILLGHFEKN
jgi:excinuclease ABC subunit C